MTANMTFDDLYTQHFQSNVHFVQFRYGLNREDAEDIVQIALIRIWDEYPTLQLDSPVGYLRGRVKFVVAYYLSYRHLATSLDAPVSDDADESLQEVHDFAPTAPTVEDQAITHLQLEQVAAQMHDWSTVDQLVFRMNLAGYTYREIHQHLVLQHGYHGAFKSVGHRLEDARQRLRGGQQAQKVRRKGDSFLVSGSWSLVSPQCLQCGTTARKHAAKGLCGTCYRQQRKQQGKLGLLSTPLVYRVQGWSRNHAACVWCGTTEREHRGRGYCSMCYETHRCGRHQEHPPVKSKRRIVALLK